ncbi:MAG: ribosome biogenesis GTPase Der [Candidatus Saccharimonadales bacterium]
MTLRTPIVAIIGRTNVGKSSLYNAILKKREAIVAKEPGTTRDSLMDKAHWKNKEFWLVDTAGLKDPKDDFEFTIQEQIYMAADNADVIIVMVEADVPINDDDRKLAVITLKSKKPVILVINKIDKSKPAEINHYTKVGIDNYILISVTQGKGIDELLNKLLSMMPKLVSSKSSTNDINLAIIGRPNVGKSYLFNALAKKQQAIVSDRAGTTRDINRTSVKYHSKNIQLMDTAGIRRAGKIGVGIERFSVLRTISAIEQADICLLVMDASELNVNLDLRLAGLIKESGKGLILVVSKWDILEDKDAFTRDQLAAKIADRFAFVPWSPLIFTSSVTGQNVTNIFDIALDIYKNRSKRIATSELNKWLVDATAHLAPAGSKNRKPKLNYMTQETDNQTPSFKIFGSNTRFIHFSYKRYLEKRLRYSYDFSGTPIEFWFIEKHLGHKHGVSPTKQKKIT